MNSIRQIKICNCIITTDKDTIKRKEDCSFCKKCGSIMFKKNGWNINYTLKSKKEQTSNGTNPFETIKTMKKNFEKSYPHLINGYNMNKKGLNDEIDENPSKSMKIYLKNRNLILTYLKKLTKIFDYNDMVFYQCLFFMDYVFSHQIKQELCENELIYYLIGYFLCSTKMKETESNEPPLLLFANLKEDFLLSVKKIQYYEVLCLKSVNYNIFSYSAYDWIIQLIGNGIIFNCEIDDKNSIIMINGHRNSLVIGIKKLALKMLLDLTQKNVFFKYSPMHIAFSIIQLVREKYLNFNLINKDLYNKLINLYGIKFDDYKKCYEELKLYEVENISEKEKEEQKEQNILDYQYKSNENKLKQRIIKQHSIENSHIANNIFRKGQKFLLNNNNLKDKFIFEKENSLKAKKINENLETNAIKYNEKDNKIVGTNGNENQNNIQFNDSIQKKIKILPAINKKKSLESYDNLPLINLRIETKIEPLKEKSKTKIMKSSKNLFRIHNNSVTKINNIRENKFNQNLYNIPNKTININKFDEPLINLAPIKKTMLKLKENNPNKRKSLNKIKIFQFKNSTNLFQFNENNKGLKKNNNIELIKNNIDKISFKLKKKFDYRLGTNKRIASIPNKNKSSDFIEKLD